MPCHKVIISGVDTANIKVLSSNEMINLLTRYKNGEKDLKDELVTGNLKLVLSIMKKFSNNIENLDDMFQVGVIGLIKAIDNFDSSYNVMFSTYAVPMIEGEIKRFIRDNSSIRISRSIKDLAYKILRYKDEYILNNGIVPPNELIAKDLCVSEYDIVNALNAMRDPISMFEPIYNDGGDTIYLYDQIEDKRIKSDDVTSSMAIEDALKKLTPRENLIIESRFVIGKTQMEIAEELGISQAQVSRIEKSAIDIVKKLVK